MAAESSTTSATGSTGAAGSTELVPGVRVRLADLQSRPDLNGIVGTLGSFDPTKGRWAVNLGSEGTKLFNAGNLVALKAEEAGDVMRRLTAAMAADQKWSLEHGTRQRRVPSGREGVLEPLMWHIQENVCRGNRELSKYVMSVMAHVTQKPDLKQEPQLDDAHLNGRVANFLKAYRDA
mmetsp:Transcript_42204/g.97718  ORF Transcript_42204/g.97718 Transcript_42204/m.97718 type:complete len:178 (-) Transcript_42204:52-585(-)